jgi:hypothetical protein
MDTTTTEQKLFFRKINLSDESLSLFAEALDGYHQELADQVAICKKHSQTAAIHDKGKELQLYRLFHRDAAVAEHLRNAAETLPSWQEALDWSNEGQKWEKIKQDVTGRMTKHNELLPLVTKGIAWEGRPVLIHAYKFEADPMVKVELVLPHVERELPTLPLRTIASALRCHEYLVPSELAEARPPYERHEAEFLSIPQYLSQTMPSSLYATQVTQELLPIHKHV